MALVGCHSEDAPLDIQQMLLAVLVNDTDLPLLERGEQRGVVLHHGKRSVLSRKLDQFRFDVQDFPIRVLDFELHASCVLVAIRILILLGSARPLPSEAAAEAVPISRDPSSRTGRKTGRPLAATLQS